MAYGNMGMYPYQMPQGIYGGYSGYYPSSMQTMQQQQTGLNRVTGIDGARAFAMQPNSVAALFDDTRDVFYVKTTDSGGFPTIKAFAFTPINNDVGQAPAASGMTREEIEKIVREEIETYGQQFIRKFGGTDRTEQQSEPVSAN